MSGHSLPTIQNLQPHSFCGQLGAFVIRADLARLKNLCVLVYEKMRTRPMRSRNRSKLEYRLQTFRHVGRFVVHVGAQTAMVLLDTPISVAKDEILAFTSLISPAELALTRNADITLQSPAIATTGPFAKLERTAMLFFVSCVKPPTVGAETCPCWSIDGFAAVGFRRIRIIWSRR